MSTITTLGSDVADFIETLCKHNRGDSPGQYIELRPFQREIIDGLFELNEKGLWKHKHSLVMLPRKSGKSELLSAVALWALVASSDWAPEVYCVAASKEQARIVLDNVKSMVQLEPELDGAVEVYKDSLFCPMSGGVLKVLSSDGRLAHGLNPTLSIIDETWAHPSGELTEALLSGSGARKQSQCIHITTPGSGDDSYLWSLVEYSRRVESGEINDPTWYSYWKPPPDGIAHDSQEAWEHHPAYSDWIDETYFRSQVQQLPEGEFRRLHLGQWTKAREQWLSAEQFDACPEGTFEPGEADVVFAVDASFANDSTVVVAATPEKKLRVLEMWEKPLDSDETWRVPLDEVHHRLVELIEEWKPRAVVYDPFAMQHAMLQIEVETGAELVEYPQQANRMVPACSQFAELVLTKQLIHDHHPALSRHVANCHTKSDRLGVRVTKESRMSKRRIDAAVASIMAIDSALRLEAVVIPPQPRIY